MHVILYLQVQFPGTSLLFYYMTINQGKNHTLIILVFTHFCRIKLTFSLKNFKAL